LAITKSGKTKQTNQSAVGRKRSRDRQLED
jgi:hypothetical protein